MSCRAVRGWLHRDAGSLAEVQRLILDDHLGACERCRGERARMQLLHRVGASLEPPPPGDRVYGRAIARALLEGGTRREVREPPRRWALRFAVAATAAAAAAATAIAWFATRGDELRPAPPAAQDRATAAVGGAPAPPAPSPVPAPPFTPADQIESGALRDGGATLARGAAVPPSTLLRAAEPARLRLASALVVVAASAELQWLPVERTILLDRGRLDIETAPGGVARIATPHFEVELDDAELTIEPAAVRVHRGAARIVDRAGRAIAARLEAGGAWTPPEPAGRPPRVPGPREASAPSAAQLLARARARFAARDLAGAEQAADAALASAPTRPEAAEARTLLADIALAAGDLEQAAARYGAVAAGFAELPAAESALYAAARIELRRARPAEARALLARYLARYPAGRYADDARRQLTSIHD